MLTDAVTNAMEKEGSDGVSGPLSGRPERDKGAL